MGTPASSEERHRLTTRALLRAHGGRAVAAHHSALILQDLPTFRAKLGTVRLNRVTPGPPRTRLGLSMGRVVSPTDLKVAVKWVEKHPHPAQLESFHGLADGRRESPGETRLGYAFHLMGVAVTPQFSVKDGAFLAFLDFVLDDWPVAFEFDGRIKYGRIQDRTDNQGRPITAGEAVWCEKQGEDHLRELGYEVVRVIWSDLDDLESLNGRRRAAVERAKARGSQHLTQSRGA